MNLNRSYDSRWIVDLTLLSSPVDIGDMNWAANANSFVAIDNLTERTTNETGQGL